MGDGGGCAARGPKPANVLLASDSHVKVADFGISKLMPSARDSAAVNPFSLLRRFFIMICNLGNCALEVKM